MRTIEVGYRQSVKTKVPRESLMLTDDENIIDLQFSVQYTLKDPEDYLFSNRDPDEAVKQAAETAMREIVAPPKRRNKQKQPMAIPVNKETCKHLVIKHLPVGTWCRDCGSKMPADAQSKV